MSRHRANTAGALRYSHREHPADRYDDSDSDEGGGGNLRAAMAKVRSRATSAASIAKEKGTAAAHVAKAKMETAAHKAGPVLEKAAHKTKEKSKQAVHAVRSGEAREALSSGAKRAKSALRRRAGESDDEEGSGGGGRRILRSLSFGHRGTDGADGGGGGRSILRSLSFSRTPRDSGSEAEEGGGGGAGGLVRKVSRSLSFNRGRSESAAVDDEVAALRQDEVVALLDYLRKGGSQLALKSGYVEKQAVDSRKVDRRWKKRWFELHAHVIVWYKEPNTAPKGYMMLTAANTVGQTIVGKGQAIVLASSTTSRSLQFRAAYAPEHRAWLEAIGGAELQRTAGG